MKIISIKPFKRKDTKMQHYYAISIKRCYNVFDAWITTDVVLYKASKNGKKWKPIAYWSYDAIFSRTLSMNRAERKARKLIREYDACLI